VLLCWSAGRFIPGCYTLAVSEELPEEYQVRNCMLTFSKNFDIYHLLKNHDLSRGCAKTMMCSITLPGVREQAQVVCVVLILKQYYVVAPVMSETTRTDESLVN
jgi:hypothetical protein